LNKGKKPNGYNKVLGEKFTIKGKTTSVLGRREYARIYMRMKRNGTLVTGKGVVADLVGFKEKKKA
jgi:hypothetical protein